MIIRSRFQEHPWLSVPFSDGKAKWEAWGGSQVARVIQSPVCFIRGGGGRLTTFGNGCGDPAGGGRAVLGQHRRHQRAEQARSGQAHEARGGTTSIPPGARPQQEAAHHEDSHFAEPVGCSHEVRKRRDPQEARGGDWPEDQRQERSGSNVSSKARHRSSSRSSAWDPIVPGRLDELGPRGRGREGDHDRGEHRGREEDRRHQLDPHEGRMAHGCALRRLGPLVLGKDERRRADEEQGDADRCEVAARMDGDDDRDTSLEVLGKRAWNLGHKGGLVREAYEGARERRSAVGFAWSLRCEKSFEVLKKINSHSLFTFCFLTFEHPSQAKCMFFI